MTALAVFAYGSLVSAASASQTLGRPVRPLAASLAGHRRTWTLARDNHATEKTFALADGSLPSHCLALDLVDDPGAPEPNGALIGLSAAELERLDARELRYRRIDVTAAVTPSGAAGFETVYAFVARRAHHRPAPPAGAVVVAAYLRAVESAFAELGPGELERFRATTADPPAPVVEADLVRDAVPPGNPREW